ncbi:MAG: hypothetical protein WC644_02625 [Ignavibacteria bacterium]
MKTKIYTFVLFLLFPVFVSSQTIPFLNENHFKTLNFECGGFVTAVYPAFNNTTNLGSQWLYAKTDVGGVYKSTNNGDNWTLISNYYHDGILGVSESMFFSHYVVAGLAVNPTDKEKLILAWGSWKTQDYTDAYGKCVLYTVNGGATWEKSNFYDLQSNLIYGPRFDGDVFENKLGGECISYHPGGNIIYLGGLYDSTRQSKSDLFVSTDGGINFYLSAAFNSVAETGDSIISLAYVKNSANNFQRL